MFRLITMLTIFRELIMLLLWACLAIYVFFALLDANDNKCYLQKSKNVMGVISKSVAN